MHSFDLLGFLTFIASFQHCPLVAKLPSIGTNVVMGNFVVGDHFFLSFSSAILAYLSRQLPLDLSHACSQGDDLDIQTPFPMLP
jgi:hypothetical protein